MSRDYRLFLDDMKVSCEKIFRYTNGMTCDSLLADEKTFDAVVRNLEIIGEASKHVPVEVKDRYSDVAWTKASSFRNIIAHEYFGIDEEILWDVIRNHVPRLLAQIISIIDAEGE